MNPNIVGRLVARADVEIDVPLRIQHMPIVHRASAIPERFGITED